MQSSKMSYFIKKYFQIDYFKCKRQIYSRTEKWDDKFTYETRVEVEEFWKNKVNNGKKKGNEKFYCLSMFPYPSGNLHMGHVRVYTISDVIARYHRLRGMHVIHPMGWDAFGLPAENAAFEKNVEPAVWTKNNILSMKEQLLELGCDFDWQRELSTCDPHYYKWTQHLFVLLFKQGLAYRKTAQVNWDPVDKTVLADEQISEEGRSWRSGSIVEKRNLKQWYIRTTAYSKSLYEGLEEVDKDLWRDVVSLQRNWIGLCEGVRLEFPLELHDEMSGDRQKDGDHNISIFTSSPLPHLLSISHFIVPHDHYLATNFKDESGVIDNQAARLTVQAINPFTNHPIPIFASSNQELFGEFLDHYIGIPSAREEDKLFAEKHKIPYEECLEDEGLVDCGDLSGLSTNEASNKILQKTKELKIGGHVTSEKARDWLISRQRYWGTPIPIVHCPQCGAVPVPLEDLPVLLPPSFHPPTSSSSPPPSFHPPSSSSPPPPSSAPSSSAPPSSSSAPIQSPLANHTEWIHTTCPKCSRTEGVRRETDTMDTFVDSSWYFLRYLDAHNDTEAFNRDVVSKGMPVDVYIGGKEHATMHLYYARFICHFLHHHGYLPCREPFKNLLTQGMVLGRTLKVGSRFVGPSDVETAEDGKGLVEKGSRKRVVEAWEKMSKSKHNGVDPKVVLSTHGVDSTRLCILSTTSPQSDRPWSDEAFVGVLRWQKRLWSLVGKFINLKTNNNNKKYVILDYKSYSNNNNNNNSNSNTNNNNSNNNSKNKIYSSEELERIDREIDSLRNHYLLQINFHLDKTFLLHTALSKMQMLSNFLHKQPDHVVRVSQSYERALFDLIIILFPIVPSFSSELWSPMKKIEVFNKHYDVSSNLSEQQWPTVDQNFHLPMNVKINNKEVCSIRLPMPYHVTDKLMTSRDAWEMAEKDAVFKGVVDQLLGGADMASVIKRKSLINQGNSKVEFEVTIPDRYNKTVLRLLKESKQNSKHTREKLVTDIIS